MQSPSISTQTVNTAETICLKAAACPLFQGEMLISEKARDIYKRLYCTCGDKGQSRCKRIQAVFAGYRPGDMVLPNDKRTLEQIIKDRDITP
jgi:hypothetical protein